MIKMVIVGWVKKMLDKKGMKIIVVELTDQELEMMLHENVSQEWIEDNIKIIVKKEE